MFGALTTIGVSAVEFDTAPYEYNGEKGVAITGFKGLNEDRNNRETVTIPAEINGQKVLALGLPGAIDHIPGARNIGALDLSQTGVKVIEEYAFCFCPNIKGAIESDTVEKVEDCAFAFCDQITRVYFPCCYTVGGSAFLWGTRLTDVTLQEGCSIGAEAFLDSPAQIQYAKPRFSTAPYTYNGVEGVAITAFNNLSNGETVTIPAEINGKKVLALGRSDMDIDLRYMSNPTPGAGNIGALDLTQAGYLKVINPYVFYLCSNIKGTIESDTVEKIGHSAFRCSSGITSVNFPECTTVSDYGFKDCTKLTSFNAPKLTSVGEYAFSGCSSLTSITLNEKNLTSVGEYAFSDCSSLTSFNAPNLTSVGLAAFKNTGLTSFNASNLTSVGLAAFKNTGLTSFNAPNLTSVGEWAFAGCSSLTSFNAPKLTSVGEYAFSDCSSLTSVTLKKGCYISYTAFYAVPSTCTITYVNK